MTTRNQRWTLHARRVRIHATIVACGLWIVACVVLLAGPTNRSVFGSLKWSDFVFFYTLGSLSRTGDAAELYDVPALYRRQVELVPESKPEHYLPVYPPQTALLFQPLAAWPYRLAGLFWAGIILATYVGSIWVAWRPVRAALSDRWLLIAGAAAFPPFWNLVLHGQPTPVIIAAFVLAWLALDRGRSYMAGLALGLIALKPQWGLVLAAIVLVRQEWKMLAGAITSVAIQIVVIVSSFGATALTGFLEMARRYPEIVPLLEPRPGQTHSFTTLTHLLPGWWGTALWIALSGVATAYAIRIWGTRAPVSVRMGVVVLASALVNPHVIVYDLTVLAPALIWIGGWIEGDVQCGANVTRRFWLLVYVLFALLLLPTARVITLQGSVIVLGCLYVLVARATLQREVSRLADAGSTATALAQSTQRGA